jgi:hypothetical protein
MLMIYANLIDYICRYEISLNSDIELYVRSYDKI